MNRLVLVVVFLATAVPASADIINVPGQYPTIQQGIAAAVSGDIVLVAPGRYVEEIQLKAGVVVRDAGIALWNGSNAFIHNNVICHNTYDGFSTGSGATFVNNTVVSNRIGVSDNSGYGPIIMNNVITANRLYGVYGPSGGQGPVLTYNDVWNNAANYYQATPGVGSDSLNPRYVDTVACDFHLGPGSPCIDYGNPAPEYNDPDGTRNDMGAYGGPGAVSNLPTITSLVPARNALAVPITTLALAGFNVPMDSATFSNTAFRMHSQLTGWHYGGIRYDTTSRVAEFEPDDELWPGEQVTVELTDGIRSAGGDTFPGCLWQFTTAVGGGSGRFSDTVQSPVNANPTAIAAADLADEGPCDLVVAEDGPGQVSIYLGFHGGFSHLGDYSTGAGTRAVCCAAFDNGEDLDIAAANGTAGTVSILKGQGGGGFDPAVNYPCSGFPSDIAAADVDLDGDIDLVVPLFDADSVAVLLNSGDGTFGAPLRYACGDGPTAVGVGDLDNDGRPDLVITNSIDNNFASLLNTVKGNCFTAFEPMTDKKKRKIDKALAVQSRKSHDRLEKPAYPAPTLTIKKFRLSIPAMAEEA